MDTDMNELKVKFNELKFNIIDKIQKSEERLLDSEKKMQSFVCRTAALEKELERLEDLIKLLREENDFLIQLASENQSKHIHAAEQSTELSSLRAKLQATESAYFNAKSNFEKDKINLEAEIQRANLELESNKKLHQQQLQSAYLITSLLHQHKQQELKSKIQDLEDSVAALNAEIAYQQQDKSKAVKELTTKWQEEQKKVAGKQQEIQNLLKEMANKEAQHSEAIQSAKMKYEEHLLQITLQVNRGSQDSTSEMYKKRLMQQKMEHDKEVQELKRRISVLEDNQSNVKKRKAKQ